MKTNFTFIKDTRIDLFNHAKKAEQYAHSDPESTMVQLRIFAEKYVDEIYKDLYLTADPKADLFTKMTSSDFVNATEACVIDKLHVMRIKGNKAAHGKGASVDDALFLVKEAYFLSAWLYVAHDNGDLESLPEYSAPRLGIDLNKKSHQLEKELKLSSDALSIAKEELGSILAENTKLKQKLERTSEYSEMPDNSKVEQLLEKGRTLFNRIDFDMDETYRRTKMDDVFAEYDLTSGQAELVKSLDEFLNKSHNQSNVFLLKGYAGTGKTFITKGLTEYFKAIKRNYVLAAPTGKAAKVIANKTKSEAYTLHKTIYSFDKIGDYRTEDIDGTQTYKFYSKLAVNEDSVDTVYIVDEASMVSDIYNEAEFFRFGSGHLLKDFLRYINLDHNDHSKKVIFIGDDAQLPPIGMKNSPALDTNYLSNNYHLRTSAYELTEVVRQKSDSGVMYNAQMMRHALHDNVFNKLDIDLSYSDVVHVEYADLIDKYMESCNHKINAESIIIAHSNADVADYNYSVRSVFFPGHEKITPRDKVMAVTNSNAHGFFISNGDFGQVRRVISETEKRLIPLKIKSPENNKLIKEEITLNFLDVTLAFRNLEGDVKFFDAKIVENLLYSKEPSLSSVENKALYVDFCIRHPRLKPKTKEFTDTLMSDPYFNALRLKFGYAITCHKAQGSEWNNVFVKCKTHQNQLCADYFRWLYTAITRTSKNLYLMDEPHLRLSSGIEVVGRRETSSIQKVKNDPTTNEAPNQNIVKNEDFGTLYSPFLNNLLKTIQGIVEPHGISVLNILHQNYQQSYIFEVENSEVRINIFYNAKNKVSNLLAQAPSDLSAFLLTLLEPLKGAPILPSKPDPEGSFTINEPFLKEFHDELLKMLRTHDIQIYDLEQSQYCQRYSFMKNNEVAVFDIYYNKKKQVNKAEPKPSLSTSDLLIDEVANILPQG